MPGTLCASVEHRRKPGVWNDEVQIPKRSPPGAFDVPVVALPGTPDRLLSMGNTRSTYSTVVEYLDLSVANPAWTKLSPLNRGRSSANAVLLPDASVLLVGGQDAPGQPLAAGDPFFAELYKNGTWYGAVGPGVPASVRDAHATALLLPGGEVVVAGGDNRSFDYEIYHPWYLRGGAARPVITSVSATQVGYRDVITVTWNPLPPGTQVERAVLMAPGSVTHHFDMHQRYVALEFAAVDETQGLVTMPRNATYAPPGYSMLILVTSGGVPSVATWIWLR